MDSNVSILPNKRKMCHIYKHSNKSDNATIFKVNIRVLTGSTKDCRSRRQISVSDLLVEAKVMQYLLKKGDIHGTNKSVTDVKCRD